MEPFDRLRQRFGEIVQLGLEFPDAFAALAGQFRGVGLVVGNRVVEKTVAAQYSPSASTWYKCPSFAGTTVITSRCGSPPAAMTPRRMCSVTRRMLSIMAGTSGKTALFLRWRM